MSYLLLPLFHVSRGKTQGAGMKTKTVTSVSIRLFVGVMSVFGCNNTTLSPHSHHPVQQCDLIMPPFRSASHSKEEYVSGIEGPCLFGVIVPLFWILLCENKYFVTVYFIILAVSTHFPSQVAYIC